MDRAIRPQNMVPLYLSTCFTSVEERKPMTQRLMSFLWTSPRIRVEDIDEGLGLMEECGICKGKTKVGAQISVLQCKHAFHSHCVVGWLEDNRLCPVCQLSSYKRHVDSCPPLERLRLSD
ncbi:E3 ubiquitin-protein ligase rnf126-b [Phtheirospermum japonicum]|uniref:RING-type E3 ubiquitin transferase n=1 Tax=Phtheirospermum japonicum TaxID=374723 RepID=A0A830B2P8_9LAMI|nr:E3 ubiquitin-protein ligase rnf126-b [Phtheirospermum japonicum]